MEEILSILHHINMKQFEVPIVQKSYDLYSHLHKLQKSVPKTERHSLWLRVQNAALDILEGLLQTGYVSPNQRVTLLAKIGAQIDMLRVFLRLSSDTKTITAKQYALLQEQVDEIGRMLGGWLKSMRTKK